MYNEIFLSALNSQLEYYRDVNMKFNEELESMPCGSLNYKRVKGNIYYYRYFNDKYGGSRQEYIRLKESQLINKLKRKQFLKLSVKRLEYSLCKIERFLDNYIHYNPGEVWNMIPEGIDGSYNITNSGNDNSNWAHENYEKNESHLDNLMHWTAGGLNVRSKSEAIIAGLLEKENIPFRYENKLQVLDKIYYPDFTIKRPSDGKLIYWEHFGMVDNEDYNLSMDKKMAAYRKAGILPWDQLITTYETKKNPVDARNIQKIINVFIL